MAVAKFTTVAPPARFDATWVRETGVVSPKPQVPKKNGSLQVEEKSFCNGFTPELLVEKISRTLSEESTCCVPPAVLSKTFTGI
ncbi:MAG: hypothetical protein IPP28_10435 [Xanthomonadales bacterium]|nr:hypothetical protein [Xanthomonadales bacterium]